MMLLIFLFGMSVGVGIGMAWAGYLIGAPEPSFTHYYRGGYTDGHRDGAVGIWRGGPIK